MIAFERLVALAAGEDDDETETHVLSCGACASMLERLLAIGNGVRDVVRRGAMRVAASKELFEELEREGLVKRVYRFQPGDIVSCTATAEDVFVAAHLHADFGDATRIDVVFRAMGMEIRADDVPFDRERGLVIVLERGDFLRTLPDHVMKCELVADGEKVLATYTFDHHATA